MLSLKNFIFNIRKVGQKFLNLVNKRWLKGFFLSKLRAIIDLNFFVFCKQHFYYDFFAQLIADFGCNLRSRPISDLIFENEKQ
jgi:hypothetical protein